MHRASDEGVRLLKDRGLPAPARRIVAALGVGLALVALLGGGILAARWMLREPLGERLEDACLRNDPQRARKLLLFGANPNHPSRYGLTPLESAIVHGDAVLTGWLLSCGANPNKVGWLGDSPLSLAVIQGKPRIVGLLCRAGADPSGRTRASSYLGPPLATAVATGDVESAQILLDYGADPDQPDSYGMSARMFAEESDDYQILHLFDPPPLLTPMVW